MVERRAPHRQEKEKKGFNLEKRNLDKKMKVRTFDSRILPKGREEKRKGGRKKECILDKVICTSKGS